MGKSPLFLTPPVNPLIRGPFIRLLLLTAAPDPQRYKEIRQANIRQRVAPAGGFGVWLFGAYLSGTGP